MARFVKREKFLVRVLGVALLAVLCLFAAELTAFLPAPVQAQTAQFVAVGERACILI